MFTDRQIAALKPKRARYERPEPGRTGLRIRVGPAGDKAFTFQYRFNGQQKRLTLGYYPDMGVRKAHIALADAREKLKRQIDPSVEIAQERAAERNAETISDLCEQYLKRRVSGMRPSSARVDQWMIRRFIEREWGTLKAKDITRRDCIKLLDKIEENGALILRNRVAGLISRLFQFALDRAIVESHPAVRLPKLPERSRDRFLDKAELVNFWTGLERADMTPIVRVALRFILVTGQRRAEVAGAAAAEFDRQNALWTLPAERAKNGREHILPLPPLALRLLEEADAMRVRPETARDKRAGTYDATPSPWQFPSWKIGEALQPAALTHALNRNRNVLGIGDATVHDLRRSFATWCGELGVAPEVLSGLLNHAPTSITGRVYNRASNLEPRRRAMNAWGAWLERLLAGEDVAENVIRLQRDVPTGKSAVDVRI